MTAPWVSIFPNTIPLLLQLLGALIAIVLSTRFLTGRKYHSDLTSNDNPQRPATLPYWFPYLGHSIPLLFIPEHFLRRSSQQSPRGIFSLNIVGTLCSVISNPNLIKTVSEDHASWLEFDSTRWKILVNVFGASKSGEQAYATVHQQAHACLAEDGGLENFASAVVSRIQDSVPDLVSFSESMVDQYPWERMANPTHPTHPLVDPKEEMPTAVELDLFALVSNFVGLVILNALLGTDFVELYPSALSDLQELDKAFHCLALGFPHWLPFSGLAKAHMARQRLLVAIDAFHRALDKEAVGERPDDPSRNVSDASPLMQRRSGVWREKGVPPVVKASADLSLIWSVTTKANALVFWMLLHAWVKPSLVEELRREMPLYAVATQPPKLFAIPEPPRLDVDAEGLVQSCPLLKACFQECIRLHSTLISVRSIQESFLASERSEDTPRGGRPKTYSMEARSYVVTLLGVHVQGFKRDLYPEFFRPQKFIKEEKGIEGKRSGDGEGPNTWGVCPGKTIAEKETFAFVAAILALWDYTPSNPSGWVVPGHSSSSVVAGPLNDIRVVVRPRELPTA